MMTCRDYVFLLTSEQLPAARWPVRTQASLHRMVCRRCRAFTANDQRLAALLREGAEGQPPEPPAASRPHRPAP